ncbi:hypothetical protein BH09PLA1_BH09PLA1_14510 [soil metagenome]
MHSQNGRDSARTLRDHLSQRVADERRELDRKINSSATSPREDLFAEVSQEAADQDYERWDGMS